MNPKRTLQFLLITIILAATPHLSFAQTAPTPAPPPLDKLIPLQRFTLKTNGLSPKDAFDLLGKQVGLTFIPGRDNRANVIPGRGIPNVWESRAYPSLDFDLDNVTFWQAADRLAELSKVIPNGDSHIITLQSMNVYSVRPNLVLDTPALRVALMSGAFRAGGASDSPLGAPRINLEFLPDPRARIISVEKLVIEAVKDPAGNDIPTTIAAPPVIGGTAANILQIGIDPRTRFQPHGILAIHTSLAPDAAPGVQTVDLLRGHLLARVATATNPVEFTFDDGYIKDTNPKNVGDWIISISDSTSVPPPRGPTTGPARPDRRFTLKIERATPTAPPLPATITTAARLCDANGLPVAAYSITPSPENPTTRQWTLQFVTLPPGTTNPPIKFIIDVPTESKPVSLPFEFKKIPIPPR